MKNLLLGLFALVCIAVITGCTSINSSDGGNLALYPDTVGPTDYYRPLYKVDPNKRVKGSAHTNVLFGIFAWGDDTGLADNADIYGDSFLAPVLSILPDAKRRSAKAAFYNACREYNCDSIVAARYEIVQKNYLIVSLCKVEVQGFPATLTGVEVVKPVQYYVDGEGKIVFLDKFINPIKIFDARPAESAKTHFWFF